MMIVIRICLVITLFAGIENARAGTISRSEDNSPEILYFGQWTEDNGQHISDTPYAKCYYTFRKSEVRWIGSMGSDHGFADIYIDGIFRETVDTYSERERKEQVLYQKEGLSEDRIHTIHIVIKREKNPLSSGNYQAIDYFESKEPVDYRSWYKSVADTELAQIDSNKKSILPMENWKPVFNKANVPVNDVRLLPGAFMDCFIRNISYLNHCFSSPTYCDGIGWSSWLPKSNDGRMLQVASNTLRWGERSDMRDIVNTIVSNADYRQRADGYSNYYSVGDSYELSSSEGAWYSERKNYDRVFWTRGMLDAGFVGNLKAYEVVRKFYDWFNINPNLGSQLDGGNATNGTPGGGLVYFSPIGKREDMETTLKYFDQEYWIRELKSENPLCISYYPGDRPHCYDLLTFEAFIDEYRATGDLKYMEAVMGGWQVYNDYYKHTGGITAICENRTYPPGSYYLVNTIGEDLPWEEGYHNGETCGSVFWINLNSKLLQLSPEKEKYALEVEEGIYNTMLACQDAKGYIKYHMVLDGVKEMAKCENSCCENSATGMIAKLPQYIYSIADDGIYINLFAPSAIKWQQDTKELSLVMKTVFPYDNTVSIDYIGSGSTQNKFRIRIPSWATGDVSIEINKTVFATGEPGTYVTLERIWNNGDVIDFTIPMGLRMHKYTGLNQDEDYDRYALMYGPLLMALVGESHIDLPPEELVEKLTLNYKGNLQFPVNGMQNTKYVPYFLIGEEHFTCYPTMK